MHHGAIPKVWQRIEALLYRVAITVWLALPV